jgi:general secretion pathway protein I
MTDTDEAGFTLVETLVALVVLAMILAALSQALGTGWRGLAAAAGESEALALAQSRLASVGIEAPFAAGVVEGETEGGLRWRVETNAYESANPVSLVGRPRTTLWRVVARVTWSDPASPAGAREIVLETVKIAGGGR